MSVFVLFFSTTPSTLLTKQTHMYFKESNSCNNEQLHYTYTIHTHAYITIDGVYLQSNSVVPGPTLPPKASPTSSPAFKRKELPALTKPTMRPPIESKPAAAPPKPPAAPPSPPTPTVSGLSLRFCYFLFVSCEFAWVMFI